MNYLLTKSELQIPTRRSAKGDERLPLSFAQQRLFFLQQLEADGWHYNIPIVLRLAGRLRIPALERALTEILRRHEALRATFMVKDGAPVQVIAPARGLSLEVLSLEDSPEH